MSLQNPFFQRIVTDPRVFFKHFPATVIRLQELNLGLSFETQSYLTSHKKRFSPSAIVKPNIDEEYIIHYYYYYAP